MKFEKLLPASRARWPEVKARRSLRAFLALVCVALLSPLEGRAQEMLFEGPALSFSNLEVGYEQRYFDLNGVDDGNGFHAGFSLAPIPILYIAGDFNYSSAQSIFGDEDISFIDTNLGLGARITLLDTLAVYIEGGGAYGQLDGRPSANYDGFGYYIEPGVKLGLFGRVELSVAADFTYLKDETILGGKAGAMIGITDNLGLTLEGGFSDHTDFLGLGLRIAW
jgi:hypothetical protein